MFPFSFLIICFCFIYFDYRKEKRSNQTQREKQCRSSFLIATKVVLIIPGSRDKKHLIGSTAELRAIYLLVFIEHLLLIRHLPTTSVRKITPCRAALIPGLTEEH